MTIHDRKNHVRNPAQILFIESNERWKYPARLKLPLCRYERV